MSSIAQVYQDRRDGGDWWYVKKSRDQRDYNRGIGKVKRFPTRAEALAYAERVTEGDKSKLVVLS